EHAGMLRYIAVERITAELRKLYRGINVQSAKDVIAKTDMLSYLPFFQYIDKEQYIQSRALSLEQEAVVHIYRDSALEKHLRDRTRRHAPLYCRRADYSRAS